MSKTKRILGVLLAAVMLIGMLPLTVFGAGIIAQGNCGDQGDNVKWVLTDKGTLTISGEGDMYDYNWYESPFSGRTDIKNAVIQNGVTSIGSYAFYKCTGLTSIEIPDSVTSIGSYAFYKCTGLTDVFYTGTEEQWKKLR